MLTARVHQRADASVGRAGDDGVARMQRAALHEHGCHRAAALVEVGLDDETGGQRIGVGAKLEHVGLQQDGLEQVVDVQLLLRRNVDEHVLSAPVLGDDAVLDELLAHAVGVGAGLVDLVDGHHDRHVSGLSVVDSLDGLRHDAVVGSDDQDDDVGHLGTAGTHGREGLVTRRVDEGDLAIADAHDRGADVLGDAAGLALGDAGVADGVAQRRLAMVDVAHDGDDGRTRLEVIVAIVVDDGELFLGGHNAHLAAHVVGDELDELVGHGLGERKHLAEHEQALDDVVGLHAQQLGELGNGGTLRDLDDGIVEHKAGIEASFDGLHLHALAGLGLALLLALLTTTLALMGVGGGNGGTRLGEHLVALQLLGLHGHLGVAVLPRRLLLELGHVLLDVHALLAVLAGAALLLVGIGAAGGLLGLLLLDALLLGLDLGKQAIEAGLSGTEHRSLALGRRGCGLMGRALGIAVAQSLFDGLLLGNFLGHGGGAGTGLALGGLAGNALLLGLDLVCQALEGVVGHLLGLRLGGGLGRRAALLGALGALGLAGCALLLDGLATSALGLGLLTLGLGALLGELLGLFGRKLARALLDLRGQVLANLLHIGFSQHAGMAFRGDLHFMELIEHVLAGHVELLRQLMYSHAGHIPLLYISLASRACAAISAAIRS